VSYHRAKAITNQLRRPINAKRLAYKVGLGEKSMRQWLRRHCYQQCDEQWCFTDAEAERIVSAYRNGGAGD
jgi:hypothetical protein